MKRPSAEQIQTYMEKLKLFFALSRTPHGLIDMATPAMAALLCLGHFPSFGTTLVGLITVFAGYTAVYALNDLVDLRVDKEKIDACGGLGDQACMDLDNVGIRHPMAAGVLSFSDGLKWAMGWALVALLGAWWLNPVCVYIFGVGAVLETLYCKLWQVTPFRTVVNGIVKTLGPIAAVFAVDPSPSPMFLILLFTWLFAWEVGGQNIPNDWSDLDEDRRFKARTVPIALGLNRSALLIMVALLATLCLNTILLLVSPLRFPGLLLFVALAINLLLLIRPAILLRKHQARTYALQLFNRASYYPLAQFALVLLALGFPH